MSLLKNLLFNSIKIDINWLYIRIPVFCANSALFESSRIFPSQKVNLPWEICLSFEIPISFSIKMLLQQQYHKSNLFHYSNRKMTIVIFSFLSLTNSLKFGSFWERKNFHWNNDWPNWHLRLKLIGYILSSFILNQLSLFWWKGGCRGYRKIIFQTRCIMEMLISHSYLLSTLLKRWESHSIIFK